MRILFVAAEVSPFTKVGGLADVAGSLPVALAEYGHDVRVVMPRYYTVSPTAHNLKTIIPHFEVPLGSGSTGVSILEGSIPVPSGMPRVPVYFVQNQHHFERPKIYGYDDDGDRFIVFCQAALRMLPLLGWRPDIVHANDWHTGLVPNYLKTLYRLDMFLGGIRTAFTIHNLAYQGTFYGDRFLRQANLQDYGIVWGDRDGVVNVLGRGIAYSDAVNTVSPTYASQIMTAEYGENLDWLMRTRWGHLWGILNGIDYHFFNPATDIHIAVHYDIDSIEKKRENKFALQKLTNLPVTADVPLIGMVSRLADQKGFDLLAMCVDNLLQRNMQLVILGTGEYYYHDFLYWLAQRHPDKVSVMLAFDAAIAQKIYAGSDMFLMPSRFEPGGLGQLIAMRYGSVPVVRHTGGLADTVQEYNPFTRTGNGFLFGPYEASHLEGAVDRALAVFQDQTQWQSLIKVNMARDSSWETSARQYLDFYKQELGLS
jgi:starch synthase